MVDVDVVVVNLAEVIVVEVDSTDNHVRFSMYHRVDFGHQS